VTGRSLAEPAFPDDDGRLDPRLGAVLGDTTAVLSLLGQVRVFVPIVATLGEASRAAGPEALVSGDKDADMAAVLMTGRDGRHALLTFTSLDAMARWNPQARPVPVWGQAAAVAALSEGAAAILLDLGSPHFQVVETDDLRHVAAGDRLVATDAGHAWVTGS
jgi:SseB protein N-terminal domain